MVGMVSSQDNRQCTGLQDLPDTLLDAPVTACCIGMNDIGIAKINDGNLAAIQISDIILMVICPAVTR